jgi:hypothetical protein
LLVSAGLGILRKTNKMLGIMAIEGPRNVPEECIRTRWEANRYGTTPLAQTTRKSTAPAISTKAAVIAMSCRCCTNVCASLCERQLTFPSSACSLHPHVLLSLSRNGSSPLIVSARDDTADIDRQIRRRRYSTLHSPNCCARLTPLFGTIKCNSSAAREK